MVGGRRSGVGLPRWLPAVGFASSCRLQLPQLRIGRDTLQARQTIVPPAPLHADQPTRTAPTQEGFRYDRALRAPSGHPTWWTKSRYVCLRSNSPVRPNRSKCDRPAVLSFPEVLIPTPPALAGPQVNPLLAATYRLSHLRLSGVSGFVRAARSRYWDVVPSERSWPPSVGYGDEMPGRRELPHLLYGEASDPLSARGLIRPRDEPTARGGEYIFSSLLALCLPAMTAGMRTPVRLMHPHPESQAQPVVDQSVVGLEPAHQRVGQQISGHETQRRARRAV